MTLTKIAVQNLRRRKGRTLFLILIFALIIGTVVTLLTFASEMKNNLQKDLSEYGANIMIYPQSESLNMSYGGISVSEVTFDEKQLKKSKLECIQQNTPPDTQVSPKVIGLVNEPNNDYMVIGIDFRKEISMKPWWKIHGNIPQADELVLGSALSVEKNLTIGDNLNLNGQNWLIAGILEETGGDEDYGVFTSISMAREFTGNTNDWSLIELNTSDPEKTAVALKKLLPNAKIVEVTQLIQSKNENVERFTSFALFISLVLILIGLMTIAVTITSNINSRIAEFGIYRAIGFRKRQLLSVLVRENLIISIIGGMLGYLIGFISSLALFPLFLDQPAFVIYNPLLPFLSLLSAVLAGMISMAYPARKTMNLKLEKALDSF